MKRFREEDGEGVSPEFKKPSSSRSVDQFRQVQMSSASSGELTKDDAMSYLNNVKENFHDNMDIYNEFLFTMKKFKAQRLTAAGVLLRVKKLFRGRDDLILGFNTFLPQGHEITLTPEDEHSLRKEPAKFDDALNFVKKIKTRFEGDGHLFQDFLAILNIYREDSKAIKKVYEKVSVLLQDYPDLLAEFTHFLPDISDAATIQYARPGRNHVLHGDEKKTDASSSAHHNHPDSDQRNHVGKEKGKKKERNDDSLDHKIKSARRDVSTTSQFHLGLEESESAFREKVKERLQDTENYENISACISTFKSKFVSADQFRVLVDSLIGKHPDLMEACEDFITYIEKSVIVRSNKKVPRYLKVEDVDDRDKEDRERTKDHNNRERNRHDKGLAINSKDAQGQKISRASKEKFVAKPFHELDLSESMSCTPSYRLLPDNYPIPSAGCKTEIGAQVLNDHWVSVTSGSEDYSFKHMRKNQYEESLFRCEDDQFELDMLLESVNTTVKRVEDILNRMNAHPNKAVSSSSCVEELTALNLRCIERLYGDRGLDVMDVLRKNAPIALPVILTRLKQKQEEWKSCKYDFNKVWAEIYAKNHHKSLDHRSFYFKQQDIKKLSTKALLGEIKEISDKNQDEDELLLLSIAAGYKQPIKPDMEFEYTDPDVHKDLYQIMKYSFGEDCTPEHNKVMKIWSTFLEQVFGVLSHPLVTEDNEEDDVEAIKNPIAESVNNGGEDNPRLPADADNADNKNGSGEDVLDALKGPDYANGSNEIEAMPSKRPLDFVITKLTSSPIAKAKKHSQETEAYSENEREEGELSPIINLKEVVEQLCVKQNLEKNGVIADNCESASEENAVVSASESANGEGDDENDDSADESEGEANDSENEGTAMPLAIKVQAEAHEDEENLQIFYGNDSFYFLFRFYQMSYERMMRAKMHSSSSENKCRVSKDVDQSDSYTRFKDALLSLLSGSSDNVKFEEDCRAIMGAQSYAFLTLDKLIRKLVKQLQTIASDEMGNNFLHLHMYERSRNPKAFSNEVYLANARFLLPDGNLYRIERLPCPERLTIKLMRNEYDKFEPTAVSIDHEFASFLNDELLAPTSQRMRNHGVFLERNTRKLYNGDESSNFEKAMEGLIIYNGLETKIDSITKKISYVIDTEDFMYRTKSRRRAFYHASRGNASSSAASKLLSS